MNEIRKASAKDLAQLANLGKQTFEETFVGMSYYTQDLIDGYTIHAFSHEKLQEELTDANSCFLVQQVEGEIAGYAKLLERVPADCVAHLNGIYLERFYLAKKFHRRGLGSLLLKEVQREASEKGYAAIWLSVWEFNLPAIGFYKTCGFAKYGKWDWAFTSNHIKYVDRDHIYAAPIPPEA